MAVSTLTSSRARKNQSDARLEGASGEGNDAAAQSDLWIFRDGKKSASGVEMLGHLGSRILAAANNSRALLDALIGAGQFESALADAGSPQSETAAELTDTLASALCSGDFDPSATLRLLSQIQPPELLSISPPEGFTYYALHPLDFANVIERIPYEPRPCTLIGIRSIGTTLSAVSAAALKKAGREACRITVRPTGHPYARITEFTTDQLVWIGTQLARGTQFLIVDEGPGRSGSTFLSVAEALVSAGVPRGLITIVGSRQPDPASLCANDAIARWNTFRFVPTTPSGNARFENCIYVGGGEWRQVMLAQPWPESWTQMERLKFLSADKKRLFKFEGMGPLGAEVRERAFVLAEANLAPQVSDAGDGFLEYDWLKGRSLRANEITSSLLDHMAQYCAFRVSNFATAYADGSELYKMLHYNVQQEFGVDLQLSEDILGTNTPVLADGRMQPYEWIALSNGTILKTDGISHGDDHFFPGPCSITWDLAGIAVEWELERAGCDYLLERFERLTGKNVSKALHAYKLAYTVFRLGYCKMAISTVRGTAEEPRLRSAYERYRRQAARELDRFSPRTSSAPAAA